LREYATADLKKMGHNLPNVLNRGHSESHFPTQPACLLNMGEGTFSSQAIVQNVNSLINRSVVVLLGECIGSLLSTRQQSIGSSTTVASLGPRGGRC